MLCRVRVFLVVAILVSGLLPAVRAQDWHDGFLTRDGQPLFPIGSYHLPDDDETLRAMADAGFNLIRCGNNADFDRVQAAGMQAWISLPLQNGATGALRKQIESVADHPALAVWERPDEIVWGFTALSGLYRRQGVHDSIDAWWRLSPEALAYAEEQAATIIPNMHAAAALVRSIDDRNRPLWMNEALKSDPIYVRQYVDSFDIIGCDTYQVRGKRRTVSALGVATDHWRQVGRGRPVWMVLQAFSWHELEGYHGDVEPAYPSFAESRFTAYSVITHGGRGILYWGSQFLTNPAFLESIHAVTAELAALQPFLTAPGVPGTGLTLVELAEDLVDLPEEQRGKDAPWQLDSIPKPAQGNVSTLVRNVGEEWLVVVVNEDDVPHMGVVIGGLDALEGQTLHELYASRTAAISHGELMLRMRPLEVRAFATSRIWESPRRKGRDFDE